MYKLIDIHDTHVYKVGKHENIVLISCNTKNKLIWENALDFSNNKNSNRAF